MGEDEPKPNNLRVTLDLDKVRPGSFGNALNSVRLSSSFAQMTSQSLAAITMPQLNYGILRQMAELQKQIANTHKRMVEAIRMPVGIFDTLRKSMAVVAEITPKISPILADIRPIVSAFPISMATEESPTMVTVLEPPPANLGFIVLIDGRFEFRSRRLQNLYHTSKQGKLLVMLLESPEHYVSNQSIKAKLGSFDPVKGIPNLMYELKRSLYKDGIEIEVTRHWGEGYQLKSVRGI